MKQQIVNGSTGQEGTLDRQIAITRFSNQRALKKFEFFLSLHELASRIEHWTAASKFELPWIKLATFGATKSSKGCYRTNANVVTITGVEADYDAGKMTPEEARDRLGKTGGAALIYTTPSHTAQKPRWRVLCPTSSALAPNARQDLLAILNGILGGILDPASFTLSQAYYAGNVKGCSKVQTFLVEGRCIDQTDWPRPIYKDGGKKKKVREFCSAGKTGLSLTQFREALMSIPNDESNTDADDRSYWFKIICGVHHETDGSAEGLELVLDWSYPHPKFDAEETERVWNSLNRKKGGVTGATIIAQANFRGNWVDQSDFDDLFTDEELAAIEIDADKPLIELDAMLRAEDASMAKLALGYDLTEDGVISAFTDRHNGELLYDHTAGAWFRYHCHRWVREETLLAKHYARAVSTELAKRDPKAKHLKKVAVWEAVERGARTVREFAVCASDWDRDAYLLGTPGGVVDLKTGKLTFGKKDSTDMFRGFGVGFEYFSGY